ncbi:hypothetical protein FOZ60_013261 [Perkinsus olseni]|uniref:Uncharacterized protein n=1 Tax=Perkinsus olseni TaxID=32597 RepID=A0A7J6N9R8_PEROL|nr:hypothetical protein FOZ60_013261 [Perkinsus olseni]
MRLMEKLSSSPFPFLGMKVLRQFVVLQRVHAKLTRELLIPQGGARIVPTRTLLRHLQDPLLQPWYNQIQVRREELVALIYRLPYMPHPEVLTLLRAFRNALQPQCSNRPTEAPTQVKTHYVFHADIMAEFSFGQTHHPPV